jgi:uncharacterized membrane protein
LPSPVRIVAGHKRTFLGLVSGVLAYWLIAGPLGLPLHGAPRMIAAWDVGGVVFLCACAILFSTTPPRAMPANADAQQEGEWTIFAITMLGVAISFAAIISGFSGTKDLSVHVRELHVALVALTLLVSWMVMQATFAMRYAHEYYQRSDGAKVDGGLQFPSEDDPDYWDFTYFSVVLGMTFQVSDVQIASRKLRRMATVHGFLGFVFNTVIIAVTVNIASGFLS